MRGNIEFDLTTTANPVFINFRDDDSGIMEIAQGSPYLVQRIGQLRWVAEQNPQILKDLELFKTGLNQAALGNYRIERRDKKTYQISHLARTYDLKLEAAIYDALLFPDENDMLLRIGNRTIIAFSNELNELWEIKTKVNIKSLVKGRDGFLILSKEEVQFYNWKGESIWRLGCPPKSD
jgi:hypothetical protein